MDPPAMAVAITSARSDPLELVGTRLAGKYDVVEVADQTAFSVVYRANHRVWRRPVAIKAFKASAFHGRSRGTLLESFVREGALLMELSERCPAICQARDIGSTTTAGGDWLPFMVLEWLEGESLETALLRERAEAKAPRTLDEAVSLLEPIAHALTLAHERGIAHRDVKPGNIFLLAEAADDAVNCKLLDFGVAKVDGDAPADSFLARSFTPEYGAPEQFSPELGPTGPRTDVFALALVLVEVVTGREPRGAGTVTELRARACDPELPLVPSAHGVAVPLGVERVLTRALTVHPDERFANARTFWVALKRAMSDARAKREEVAAEPILPLRRRASARRLWVFPAVAVASAAAALLALQMHGMSPSSAWVEVRSWTPVLTSPAQAHATPR
jgi:serine/threonine protein kinase